MTTKRHNFKELNKKFDLNIENIIHNIPYKERNRRFSDMYEWCEINCQDEVIIGAAYATFTNEDDAFAFKMRWS